MTAPCSCSGEVAALRGTVAQISGELQRLRTTVAQLEAEMYGTTNAVRDVNASVQELHHALLQSLVHLASQVGVLDESVHQVDTDVQRVSRTIADADVVGALADIQREKTRLEAAKQELDDRYREAQRRNRDIGRKYEGLDRTLLEDYLREARRWGAEIFEIWDKDYAQRVRPRLVDRFRHHLQLALATLRQLARVRAAGTDERLRPVQSAVESFLDERSRLEPALREYVVAGYDYGASDLAVEALVSQTSGGPLEVTLGVQPERASEAGSPAIGLRLMPTSYFQDIRDRLRGALGQGAIDITWEPMTEREVAELGEEFRAMAVEGVIAADYADDLRAYLTRHPPQVARRATLAGPLAAPAVEG